MNLPKLMTSLERFGRTLPVLVADVQPDDARWKPPSGAWSILEIVCHLADEEELDFRHRLRSTLADPRVPWPPIDPEGWAKDRRYNEGVLADAVTRFVTQRSESTAWLRSLQFPDWGTAHQRPSGVLRAGDLLSAWVAHDYLHLRQIAKRMYELAARGAGEYSIGYAGAWGP
jgi:hypothetical protein